MGKRGDVIFTMSERRECTFPVPDDDSERVEALHSVGILETPPAESFDRLTGLLTRVLGVPMALVSFVDKERQWFKSNVGLEGTSETHRNEAFCAHAILPGAPDVFVVHDAQLDPRFCDNALVTGPVGTIATLTTPASVACTF